MISDTVLERRFDGYIGAHPRMTRFWEYTSVRFVLSIIWMVNHPCWQFTQRFHIWTCLTEY